jgi:tetratricopeptide (TPR) repeat protein
LGELAYKAGDMTTAANYFNQALKVNNNLAEANVNEGLIALLNNDKSAAEAYLAKGSEAKAANEALGNYYIADGQYERAVNAFGNTKSNSAALAQILTKDYNKAKSTLSEVKNPDAYTSYLNAIIGARTNNSSMVIDNLKSAIAQDSSLASKAANDLEFSKFATSSAFKSLVK